MGDISHDFRNGLWLVDRAMGKGNGTRSVLGPESADF